MESTLTWDRPKGILIDVKLIICPHCSANEHSFPDDRPNFFSKIAEERLLPDAKTITSWLCERCGKQFWTENADI